MTSTESSPRPDGTSEAPGAQQAEEKPDQSDQSQAAKKPDVAKKPQAAKASVGDETPEAEEAEPDAPEVSAKPAAGPKGAARATMLYTTMRLSLFLVCFLVLSVLAWVGVIPEGIGKSNPLWLFALAILISAPLSLVLLRKQRDAMSEQIVPKVERASTSFKGRLDQNRGREDDVA